MVNLGYINNVAVTSVLFDFLFQERVNVVRFFTGFERRQAKQTRMLV